MNAKWTNLILSTTCELSVMNRGGGQIPAALPIGRFGNQILGERNWHTGDNPFAADPSTTHTFAFRSSATQTQPLL